MAVIKEDDFISFLKKTLLGNDVENEIEKVSDDNTFTGFDLQVNATNSSKELNDRLNDFYQKYPKINETAFWIHVFAIPIMFNNNKPLSVKEIKELTINVKYFSNHKSKSSIDGSMRKELENKSIRINKPQYKNNKYNYFEENDGKYCLSDNGMLKLSEILKTHRIPIMQLNVNDNISKHFNEPVEPILKVTPDLINISDINLSARETELLRFFKTNIGKVITAKDIARELQISQRDHIYKYIRNLREKLGEGILENAPSGGYIYKASNNSLLSKKDEQSPSFEPNENKNNLTHEEKNFIAWVKNPKQKSVKNEIIEKYAKEYIEDDESVDDCINEFCRSYNLLTKRDMLSVSDNEIYLNVNDKKIADKLIKLKNRYKQEIKDQLNDELKKLYIKSINAETEKTPQIDNAEGLTETAPVQKISSLKGILSTATQKELAKWDIKISKRYNDLALLKKEYKLPNRVIDELIDYCEKNNIPFKCRTESNSPRISKYKINENVKSWLYSGNYFYLEDIEGISLYNVAKAKGMGAKLTEEFMHFLIEHKIKFVPNDVEKTPLEKTNLSDKLRSSLYKQNKFYLENLKNIDIAGLRLMGKVSVVEIDELIWYLICNNIPFTPNIKENFLFEYNLTPYTQNTLYDLGIFSFADIDIEKLEKVKKISKVVLDEIKKIIPVYERNKTTDNKKNDNISDYLKNLSLKNIAITQGTVLDYYEDRNIDTSKEKVKKILSLYCIEYEKNKYIHKDCIKYNKSL